MPEYIQPETDSKLSSNDKIHSSVHESDTVNPRKRLRLRVTMS